MLAFNLDATSNQLAVSRRAHQGRSRAAPLHFRYRRRFRSRQCLHAGHIRFDRSDRLRPDIQRLPPGFIGAFTVTSNSIVFEVFGPPVIAAQPQSLTVLMGGTAIFSVAVNNSPGLGYQWFKDGVVIAGATGSSLDDPQRPGRRHRLLHGRGQQRRRQRHERRRQALDSRSCTGQSRAHVEQRSFGRFDPAMIGESVALNGSTTITGDLFAPGLPNVILNGSPNYGGTLDGSGAATPTNYTVTLNSNTTLGHVVRRTDPVPLPTVTAPTAPAGTRNVTLNNPSDPVGDGRLCAT